MSEVVLAVLGRPEAVKPLLDAARRLTELANGARLNVLAVQEPVQVGPLAAETLISEADAVLEGQRHERDRVLALKAEFDRWVGDLGGSIAPPRWIAAEGSMAAIVGERGSRADIVAVSQPAEGDRLESQALRVALFATDRPVLMVPPGVGPAFGRQVAIAWRDDKPCTRAMIPALRYLARAEQVYVFIGSRSPERPALPPVLVERGVRAELQLIALGPEVFGKKLLGKAHELAVDLLVIGAYAHSPLRELVLGGVTRYMIEHADIPVLMRH